jgi:hypothetical protein
VSTAAQALGIAAGSIADVIRRVVGDHIDKLRGAVCVVARVAQAKETLRARGAGAWNTDAEAVKAFRAKVRDGTDAEFMAAVGALGCGLTREVATALDSLAAWAEEQREKHGKALARMRDNIREGQCQCCMVPFEDEDSTAAYVLVGCCQIIVCETCITKHDGRQKIFIQRCPNCAAGIKPDTSLVRVGAELDLEEALKDEAILEAAVPAAAPAAETEPEPEPKGGHDAVVKAIDNPKLRALVQLVSGRAVECIRDVKAPPFVSGLLCGRQNRPWPDAKPKKFLVFTMHAESTVELGAALDRCGVGYSVLRGTRAQKDEAVHKIQSGLVNVLLATSAKDSGGLHLPFLSHIILYHRVLDRNVEAQAVARGQRLGREFNLEVVALLNEIEATEI